MVKDWFEVEHDVDATAKKVLAVFDKWYKKNLVITHGNDRTVELTFGFPYTSTSDIGAGMWNVQCEALLKGELRFRFKGLILSKKHEVVALFEGKPFEFKKVVIGKI
jgi:hypothetical protein